MDTSTAVLARCIEVQFILRKASTQYADDVDHYVEVPDLQTLIERFRDQEHPIIIQHDTDYTGKLKSDKLVLLVYDDYIE